MTVKRLAVLLLGCLALLFVAVGPASAQCNVKFLNVRTAPDLNAEGILERGADIVIYGAGCFVPSTITVGYNAIMTLPATPASGTLSLLSQKGTYWDVVDSSEALSIHDITLGTQVISSGTASVITITIDGGTNNPAAYIVLENLRFDVTGSTCQKTYTPACQSVGDGHPLNASISSDELGLNLNPFDIGNVKKTVLASATWVGWGFENGVCPNPAFCGYPNKGATTGSLIQQAIWAFETNPAWVTDFPFRRVKETSPNPADPNLIGPTDLVVDVENIMSGVTVTLPDSMVACSAKNTPLATWKWIGGAKTSTGGNLVGIYTTTQSALVNPTTLFVYTTNGNADPGCDTYSFYPLISVKVGNPSGNSADGTMEAYLRVVMGPATNGQFTGDDVQSSAVPRYLDTVSFVNRPTRAIIGDTNPEAQPYFFLNPTETVLLYPYVTSGGWDTGIELGNTGLDTPVFGNSGQDGLLDFYFFPNGASPFSFTPTTAYSGSFGLESNGVLKAGHTFGTTLSALLTAAKHSTSFTGYIIVVAHFNYGHGAGLVFNTQGATSSIPALILGGHCDFNMNTAVAPAPLDNLGQNFTFGVSQPPACSSARQGDLTKLPEQLKM